MDHKIVYLVRHGQSIHNATPVYQSEHAPLSEKGIRQAQTVADRLASVEFETLLASPILRAKQTASHILKPSKTHFTATISASGMARTMAT